MSNSQDDIFDKHFKDAFDELRTEPDSNVWDRVEKQLADDSGNQRLLYIWHLRIAASLLILISLVYNIVDNGDELIANAEEDSINKLKTERGITSRGLRNVLSNQRDHLAFLDTDFDSETTDELLLAENSTLSSTVENSTQDEQLVLASERGEEQVLNNSSVYRKVKSGEESKAFGNTKGSHVVATPVVMQSEMLVAVSAVKANELQTEYELVYVAEAGYNENEVKYYTSSGSDDSEKWFAGGMLSPEVANSSLVNNFSAVYTNSNSDNVAFVVNDYNTLGTTVSRAYSAAMQVGYKISDRLEFQTGVNYSDWSGELLAAYNVEQQVSSTKTTIMPVPSRTGDGYTTVLVEEDVISTNYSKDTLSTNFNLQSIEVPFLFRYGFGKNKLQYFISSGLSTNLTSRLVARSSSEQYNEVSQRTNQSTGFEPTSLNVLFGAGIDYEIISNFRIRIEPLFRQGVLVKEESFLDGSYNTFGLNTGIAYQF